MFKIKLIAFLHELKSITGGTLILEYNRFVFYKRNTHICVLLDLGYFKIVINKIYLSTHSKPHSYICIFWNRVNEL